jgi:hypothetical protein
MPTEAAMPCEAVSDILCETVAADPCEAVSGVLREIEGIVPMTEIPVMVEVVEAASVEPERAIDRLVGISLVSVVVSVIGVGVGVRAVVWRCGARGKDKPYT